MTTDQQADGLGAKADGATARPKGALLPCRVINDFLDDASVEALRRLTLSREAQFRPTKIGDGQSARLAPDFRTSLCLRPLEDLRPFFVSRLRDLAPRVLADMGLSPVDDFLVELELVAHGDGAFYKRHIDTQTGGDATSRRVVSCVYYFNHCPWAFTGGALRLYAVGDDKRFLDIEPAHNSFVIFPSWAPHEVMPVSCPSGEFVNSRFAVNCWMRRPTPAA